MVVRLTEEQKKSFRAALNVTWSAIGYDIEQSATQFGERVTNGAAREAVIDYVTTHGQLSKEELTLWESLSFGQKKSIAAQAISV